MTTVVAIDGPAGAGKSTVSRLVAGRLGLVHIDTGATYRLVALRALAEGVPLDDGDALGRLAAEVAVRSNLGPHGELCFDGVPVGGEIRTPEVSDGASRVASHLQVREALVALQRRLVPEAGAVIEGRDIGTVVWPQAQVKAYLDAHEQERASRRARDLGADEGVLDAVRERDLRDATRPVSAMRAADGALVIDTTGRTPEEVAQTILQALPRPDEPRPNLFTKIVRGAWRWLLRALFRLEITGAERIPARGAAILAPNHRSLIDIPVLAALTRRKVWFMGKEELFASKLGNAIFSSLGGFPVRRGKPDRAALATSLRVLSSGWLLGVYPEGTRRPNARFEEVEDGFTYLALKSGAPIVPIAVSGTESVFPKGRKVPKLVRIRVLIGEPFSVGGPIEGVIPRSRIREATAEAQRRLVDVVDELEPQP